VSKLNPRHIAEAKRIVYGQFPELDGLKPKISKTERAGRTIYTLAFQATVSVEGGHQMRRTVRVTMDESGEIIKITSSR